jgi:hypothetical protein
MCLVIAMNAQEPRPPCVQRRVFLLQNALGKSQVYRRSMTVSDNHRLSQKPWLLL